MIYRWVNAAIFGCRALPNKGYLKMFSSIRRRLLVLSVGYGRLGILPI